MAKKAAVTNKADKVEGKADGRKSPGVKIFTKVPVNGNENQV